MGHQGLTSPPRSASDGQGWDGWAPTAMRWLSRLTQVVEVSILWFVGTLLGGIVLGWMPSTVAAGAVLHHLTGPEPSNRPFMEFFESWKDSFWRANAVGWPVTVGVPMGLLNLWILWNGGETWMIPMLFATIAILLAMGLIVGYLSSLLVLPDAHGLGMGQLWHTATAVLVASPGTILAWIITVLSLGVVFYQFPLLGVLAGPGLLILVTAWLTRRRLHTANVVNDPDQEVWDESRSTSS